jgi:hypothetical protein
MQEENVSLSDAADHGSARAEAKVTAIQIMLEQEYRDTLRDAEARLHAELHKDMTAEQHDLVHSLRVALMIGQ